MSDLSINPAGGGPIQSIRHVPSLFSSSSTSASRLHASAPSPSSSYETGDRVELSDMAQLLAKMRDMPEVRQDRIDRARAAISRGTYDSDARVGQAFEKLLIEEDLLGA